MSIVYEIGDSAMKRDLVNALVGTLTGTSKRKKAIKVWKFNALMFWLLFFFCFILRRKGEKWHIFLLIYDACNIFQLTEDSEVFQESTVGQSPGGGKLSTYKELCNMANEMGQPDLIYKFMDLANYQASLNSKRGAAFGFSKIAKQAGEVLQPFVRSLVPRLVRYQYDPDKNVQVTNL